MNTELFTPDRIEAVESLIRGAEHIRIFTHQSPDGDAMGSSLGMAHYLRALGKEDVRVMIPNGYPDFLAWMPGAEDMYIYAQQPEQVGAMTENVDLVICTDFGEAKRVGDLSQTLSSLVPAGVPSIVVDHHIAAIGESSVSLPGCADVMMIDPHAPAASLMVYQLLGLIAERTGVPLPTDAATCLYTGLMTDTGNFAFNSNHPDIYHTIAELVAMGVDKDGCYDRVFNSHTEDRMRLVGYCLYSKMKLFDITEGVQLSLIALSRREQYRFNFRSGDGEGIVNMPQSIATVRYSCFMREDTLTDIEKHDHPGAKSKVKISLRSQGDRPVNIFCHDIFDGGGHKNASGGTYYGTLREAVALFEQNFRRYFTV